MHEKLKFEHYKEYLAARTKMLYSIIIAVFGVLLAQLMPDNRAWGLICLLFLAAPCFVGFVYYGVKFRS